MASCNATPQKPLRVGVFGVGRGRSFAAQAAAMDGVELAALCDSREDALQQFAAQYPGVTTYNDFDKMLEHDLDAVVLANYATEHAPAAIKALRRGLHVQSENIAIKNMGEAVELVRAVEASDTIYMYAENYCYMTIVQEMRHLYEKGEIGEFRYGEGEYIHPMGADETIRLGPTPDHWRNWIPATYYATHAFGPLMYITRLRPVKVNGFVVPYDPKTPACGGSFRRNDLCGILMVQMDNGAYCRTMQYGLEKHGTFYRVYGHCGSMENLRQGDTSMLAVHKEPWNKEPGEPGDIIYKPEFRRFHEEASRSGHGGGDFFMLHEFVRAIRTETPPYLDVYTGLQMSCLGILAYKSAIHNNMTIDVPSFRDAKELEPYVGDIWSPDPADAGPNQPAASVLGHVQKSPEELAAIEKRARELRPEVWEND